MAIKLKATQTFEGIEGFVRKGQVFEVDNQERADKLVNELKFAEEADQDATVSQEKPLDKYTVKELKEKAKDLNIEGYSDMLKDELVATIEAESFTNGEQPNQEQANQEPPRQEQQRQARQTQQTENNPAQVQDVVNQEQGEEPK